MSKITTFVFLFFPIFLFSQGATPSANEDFFVGHEVYPTINNSTEGTRADINGDGILDLFTVSQNIFRDRHHLPTHDAAISWREGLEEENSFGERQIIFQSEVPYRMTEILWAELSDIDNDGDLDLYVAFYYDFGWMENMDGKGTFSVYTKIGVVGNSGHSNFDLFIPRADKDIDGDGFKDVLIYTGNIPQFIGAYWYKNLKGRGFSREKVFTIFDYLFHNKYIDLDADGNEEILIGDKSDESDPCYLQSFNYQEESDNLIADTLLIAERCFDKIEYHDFNGDGRKDILLLKENGLMWNPQISDNLAFDTLNFIDSISIYTRITPRISYFNYFVKIIDKEEDGDLDIFLYDQDGLHIYENKTGIGDFELFFHQPIDPSYRLQDFHWTDLDNDGDNDFLFQEYLNSADRNYYWIANLDGMGDFAEKALFFEDKIESTITLIDSDENGKINLEFRGLDGRYSLEYVDATQSFSKVIFMPTAPYLPIAEANRHQLQDIDGDEDLDLVFFFGNQLKWIENVERTKRFEPEKVLLDGLSIDNNHFIDVDNDGAIDVLSANQSWYRNEEGAFREPVSITGIEEGTPVQVVDFNHDGYPDVLGYVYDEISRKHYYQLYKNEQGSGQFTAVGGTSIRYDRFIDFKPMDIDSDGFEDLVRSSGNGCLTWYRNENGTGEFTGPNVSSICFDNINHQLYGVDMDHDGDIDIVDRSESRDGLYLLKARWLENVDGKGNFQKAHPIISASLYQKGELAIGDIDNDEDMDLIFTSAIKAPLYLNFNQQDSLNENKGLALVKGKVHGAAKILIGDLDLDGDLDLFTHTPIYAWYENLNKSPAEVTSVTKELEKTVSLKYYPNPFQESIQFEIPELPQGNWTLTIRDLYGRAIESREVNTNSVILFQNVQLTPGIYFFELKNPATQVILSSGKLFAQ